MIRRWMLVFGVACSVALLPSYSAAQGISLTLLGGMSKDSRSQTENMWNAGLNIGAHGFVSLPGVTIGGRVAYHSWPADGEGQLKEFTKNSGGVYTLQSVDGSISVIELVPSVRFALIDPPAGMRLDLQVGAGLFLVSSSTVTLSGTFTTGTSFGSGTLTLTSDALTGFGPQVALPLRVAGMIEIVPVYTAYSAGGDWYNHWALNAGVKLTP